MRERWEAGVMAWAIEQELKRPEGSAKQAASRYGWKRPWTNHHKRLGEMTMFVPNERQAAWLRQHWEDGTPLAEMEAYCRVTMPSLRKAAVKLGLPAKRNMAKVYGARRTGSEYARKANMVKRLIDEGGMTQIEAGAEVGLSPAGAKNLVRRERKRGQGPRMKLSYIKPTFPQLRLIKFGFKLGVFQSTLARILSQPGKHVGSRRVQRWGKMVKVQHRNTKPVTFRILAPEMLYAAEIKLGMDPVDWVQNIYVMSRRLTLNQALQSLQDYAAAMVMFPQIKELDIPCRVLGNGELLREPSPIIERMRGKYAVAAITGRNPDTMDRRVCVRAAYGSVPRIAKAS